MIMSGGDITAFLDHPIVIVFLTLSGCFLCLPLFLRGRQRLQLADE